MNETPQALALKYRPTTFKELIGQESVSQTLSLAIESNRVSHAYLFSGLRGSGKTSTARIFSKALLCDKGPTATPCGVCENCVLASESRHMDIIEMDGASNRGIDDIRALIEQTKYKPSISRYKIFIIDEVHMLTPQAFNALLKTLEEPPEYVKFILATTDPLKLPATILSRTQHFRFKHISVKNVSHHLAHILQEEGVEYESEALDILARSGHGSLRDSITLLDQAIIYSKRFVDVRTVTGMLGLVDPHVVADIFTAIIDKDYTGLMQFIKELEEYDAQMVADELIAYLKERMYAQDTRFSTLLIDRFFRILSQSKQLFSINADGGFVLSLLFFKMVEAMHIKEIDQMIDALQSDIKPSDISVKQVSSRSEPPIKQTQPSISKDNNAQKLYHELVAQITDRNAAIGECFKNHITFVSFKDNVLSWESCVDDECKKALRHGFGVIKQMVREIFGFETVMKNIPCSKNSDKNNADIGQKLVEEKPKEVVNSDEVMQSASTVQEIETGSGSCVANHFDGDRSTQEYNADEILNEEIVKKSIELFEATKVTIQSKV